VRRAALALLVLAALAGAQAEEYLRTFKSGFEAYNAKQFETAVARFEECTRMLATDWHGHFWNALALAQLALQADEPQRRAELLRAAQRRTELMVKDAKVGFTSPATLYLEGMINDIGGNHPKAYQKLADAIRAPLAAFQAFADVQLAENVRTAFGIATMNLAETMIIQGNFQAADYYLGEANEYVPAQHPARPQLEQHRANVDEAMTKYDSAIQRLRKCIEMSPEKREELLAGIAVIHLKNERLEDGLKVLDEARGSRHPDLLSARCFAARTSAKRAPESEEMARALKLYRETIQALAEDRVYRLVNEFAELVDERAGPAPDEEALALTREVEALLLRQVELRPECPPAYWNLTRIYRRLRDAEKEAKYGKLHELKSKEFERGKDRFDQHGRPRC